jgi:hypothetical protein
MHLKTKIGVLVKKPRLDLKSTHQFTFFVNIFLTFKDSSEDEEQDLLPKPYQANFKVNIPIYCI